MSKPKSVRTPQEGAALLRDIKDWHALLIIGVAVVIFFRNILLQSAFLWEDFLYYFYPVRNFAAVSLAHGELPLWNPYTFNGMPFQADIQSAIFYIPNLLLTLFVSNGRLHFFWVELFIVLHYIIAGVCMYYLAKSFGMQKLLALFSGLVYALSGFMIAHAIHQVIISQVAWLPLIFLLFRKTLLHTSVRYTIFAGLVLGQAILAGFPQTTLYIFFFLLLYFIFEFLSHCQQKGIKPSLPMIPLAAAVIVIALTSTAIQLLPTDDLAQLSQRAEISFQKSSVGSLEWEQLLTLIIPNFFGTSGAQGSNYWHPDDGYFNYWESCMYIGIAGIAAALCAIGFIKKNWYAAFFLWIAAFSLLYALGDNFYLHKLFFYYLPGFDTFRVPSRMSLLFTFASALLCGFGLQYILELMNAQQKKLQQIILLIVGTGILLWVLTQAGMFQPLENARNYQEIHTLATTEATTALLFILAFCSILFMMIKGIFSPTITVFVIILIQFIDIHVFGFNQNNGRINPSDYFNRTSQLVTVLREDGKDEYFRVNARKPGGLLLDRNQGMVDRIFLMEGYTPLVLHRAYPPGRDWEQVCDMLNAKYRIAIDERQGTMTLQQAATYFRRAYFVYKANIIESDSLLQSFMKSDAFDPSQTVVVEEDPGLQLVDTGQTQWTAEITSYSLNSISLNVSTPKNGILVLSEIHYPGWNAYVDGTQWRILRANWNQRAVPISAGDHHVELRFEPASFRKGVWITIAALGLSISGVTFSFFKKKKGI